eukprot:3725852-Rhodomonas_salina.2
MLLLLLFLRQYWTRPTVLLCGYYYAHEYQPDTASTAVPTSVPNTDLAYWYVATAVPTSVPDTA